MSCGGFRRCFTSILEERVRVKKGKSGSKAALDWTCFNNNKLADIIARMAHLIGQFGTSFDPASALRCGIAASVRVRWIESLRKP